MNDEFTLNELTDIDYVVVEASSKQEKDKKIEGYFLGMRSLSNENLKIVGTDEIFLWLLRASHVYILSLRHFKVDTIEIKRKDITTHSRCIEMDEELYKNKLNDIMRSFEKSKQVLKNGLVDTSTYKGMSPKLKERLDKLPDYNKSNNKGSNKSTTKVTVNNNRSGSVNYKTYQKKEIKTTSFRRTTRYVVSKAIKEMEEKIQLLREGNYKSPNLKPLNIKEEVKKEVNDSDNDDDACFGYGCGYC